MFIENGSEWGGGGIENRDASNPVVVNCLFRDNQTDISGGTILNEGSSPEIIASVLIGIPTQDGADVYSTENSSLRFTNCILSYEFSLAHSSNSVHQFASCGFEGSGGSGENWNDELGMDLGGNIDADPMFVDPDNGDFHLRPGSPCIDAGNNDAVPPEIDADLDGNPRFVDSPYTTDTGTGDAPIVDMGCYEFQAQTGPVIAVSPEPLIAGERGTFTVTDARNDAQAYLVYSLRGVGKTNVPPLNVVLNLRAPRQAGKAKTSDADGFVEWSLPVPKNASGLDIWLQAAQMNLKTGIAATSVQ